MFPAISLPQNFVSIVSYCSSRFVTTSWVNTNPSFASGISRRFTFALWCNAALVVFWFIACVIVSIAGCQPVSYFWNKLQTGQCIDEVSFFRGNGITNMILDFFVLILPLPMVWRLDLGLRQKLIISGIFLLGTLYVALDPCWSFPYSMLLE